MREADKSLDIEAIPLAVYRSRPEGHVIVEIEGGYPEEPAQGAQPARPALPPLVVQLRVPGPVDCALIEARGREALLNLLQGQEAGVRYGLDSGPVDESVVAQLAPFITAVESAAHLIVAWNYATLNADGQPVRAPVNAATIAELFRGRPSARSGWMLQFETVSPLERAEGNVSAASPNTTSATAAPIAEGVSLQKAPVPGEAEGEPGSSAPAP